jgi:hypothetical protein
VSTSNTWHSVHGQHITVCISHICCHEFNIEFHNVFIDYTQAFDLVYRDKIIKCLNEYDISSKLIKLIAKTLQDTKVKVNQNYTEKFEISTGVK